MPGKCRGASPRRLWCYISTGQALFVSWGERGGNFLTRLCGVPSPSSPHLDSFPAQRYRRKISTTSHTSSSFSSPTLNMSNGIVNGTGLENQFGQSLPSRCTAPFVTHQRVPTPAASLGINGTKSAYVPPHMRNSQRAASSPVVPANWCVFCSLLRVVPFSDPVLQELLERLPLIHSFTRRIQWRRWTRWLR